VIMWQIQIHIWRIWGTKSKFGGFRF